MHSFATIRYEKNRFCYFVFTASVIDAFVLHGFNFLHLKLSGICGASQVAAICFWIGIHHHLIIAGALFFIFSVQRRGILIKNATA